MYPFIFQLDDKSYHNYYLLYNAYTSYLHTLTQTQVHDLKQAQSPSTAQLHSMLMDPAVNLMFLKMKSELKDVKEKLAQAQTDLSAWKFSTDRSVPATVSIVRKRPLLTDYCTSSIDRCLMTTCLLLYHMICLLCRMHHCSYEQSTMSLLAKTRDHMIQYLAYCLGCKLLPKAPSCILCSVSSPLCG